MADEARVESLTAARWQLLEPLLDVALTLSPAQRDAFIDQCASDEGMQRDLRRLVALCSASPASSGVNRPAAARFASLFDDGADESWLRMVMSPPFTLEEVVGRGGMAVVYRARDGTGREVALKVLRATIGAQRIARFRREIEVATALDHENILRILDAGETHGRLWYTMPMADGGSLRDRIRDSGAVEPMTAVLWLGDVAAGLAHAHAHGVIHRDLKPDNILFRQGRLVIADFGVAKALMPANASQVDGVSDSHGGADVRTATGVGLGTPPYMAPEQATRSDRLDHRADLYALGVIAYELFRGTTPFAGMSRQDILTAQLSATAVPPELPGSVPRPLAQLVRRLISREPGDRPESASEVGRELANGYHAMLAPPGA